eukprot:Trichotokara_eunicae@DN5892_c0_g2_i3.p1
MGVGLGYAIASAVYHKKYAKPGKPSVVVAVEGDSAFGFSGMELETMSRYNLPILVVILNNGGVYGRHGQNVDPVDPAIGELAHPTSLLMGEYQKMGEAFGIRNAKILTPHVLRDELKRLLGGDEVKLPAVMNVMIDPLDGQTAGSISKLHS